MAEYAKTNWEDDDSDIGVVATQRPYEVAFDQALKEVAVLRESVVRLRDQIKPALQPEEETSEKSPGEASVPGPPQSPVVRDIGNLRYEVRGVASLVQSISNRVYL